MEPLFLKPGPYDFEEQYQEQLRIAKHLKEHFEENPNYAYEEIIGVGRNSLGALVRDRKSKNKRRLLVKRAFNTLGEEQITREIQHFTTFGGLEHIVTMVAHAEQPTTSEKKGPVGQFFDNLKSSNFIRKRRDPRRIRSKLKFKPHVFGEPFLVLEYLENGTLTRLIRRCIHYQVNAPNRVLWAIFLCLIRACVAMAYPGHVLRAKAGEKPRLEEIPTNYTGPPGGLAHQDLNPGKVMFGSPDQEQSEHNIVPALKFIDMQTANELYGGTGVDYNLFDISVLMYCMIIANEDAGPLEQYAEHKSFHTMAIEIALGGNGENYQWLDPELRDIICQCMAGQQNYRPSLRELLYVAQRAVQTKTSEAFPFGQRVNETDQAIKMWLQHVIYDAQTQPGPGDEMDIDYEGKGKGRARDEHETRLQQEYYQATGAPTVRERFLKDIRRMEEEQNNNK
ncbi:uncharacterized protein F4822DRAFT_416397 [Hypoxylon trugodes]|uniref:uncharacterized protein n=1 Tax=Hypoxylon trugodes TaxID=326681 RepID=UPI00219609C8|nr:uncharacterized protein F4822DRAFT_416397 [Hypoxylon trugodes]KAI1384834.1 hypothetical protein F4822DRAFT_416397 [Hypoxylon trugodes]